VFNKRKFEQLFLARSYSPPKEQKLTCYRYSSWLAVRTDWKVSAINNIPSGKQHVNILKMSVEKTVGMEKKAIGRYFAGHYNEKEY